MSQQQLTIEIVSVPNPEEGAWEAACEVIAECLLHLLLDRMNTEGEKSRKDQKSGPERAV